MKRLKTKKLLVHFAPDLLDSIRNAANEQSMSSAAFIRLACIRNLDIYRNVERQIILDHCKTNFIISMST